jgi:deoxyribodipyrimidine photolyase-related protein
LIKTLRLVLGDQLSHSVASLRTLEPQRDIVLMAEVEAEATYVRHHQQKIALVLASMRAFAAELTAKGVAVDYVKLDGRHNSGSIVGELDRAKARHWPERIAITSPGEHRLLKAIEAFAADCAAPVDILDDDRLLGPWPQRSKAGAFLPSHATPDWATHGRRQTGRRRLELRPIEP